MQTTHYSGLTDEQVRSSRELHGANVLTPPKKKSAWLLFLEKFKDPIIRVLLIALILSVGVTSYQYYMGLEGKHIFLEPAGILLASLLATVIGFLVEQNANKKFEILNQVNDQALVKVIRNDRIHEIAKKDLVVGDIVILDAGEEVPADGSLLEAVSLQINESTLTGEPIVDKTTEEREFDKEATYPSDQVLKGTTVAGGHGIYRVEKVGDATEYGKVYVGSQIENNTETPLNRQLGRLGRLITIASFTIAALLIVARIAIFLTNNPDADPVHTGTYILETLMIAVTLVVVSVPEGLPMSIVLSLALSMKRMLATNNLVRKMHACETMGAVSVICTDKTGTLTRNQMRVARTDFYGLVEGGDGNYPGQRESVSDTGNHIGEETLTVRSGPHSADGKSLEGSCPAIENPGMHACEDGSSAGCPGPVISTGKGTASDGGAAANGAAGSYSHPGGTPGYKLTGMIYEGIAVNSTAFLDFEDPVRIRALGNPTEGALLFWLNDKGIDYLTLRENAAVVQQLPFSTERKYMATIVESAVTGKRMLYVKGAPEIVLANCKQVLTEGGPVAVSEYERSINQQLLSYQHQAMRTLGFAYQEIEQGRVYIREDKLVDTDLTFIGIAAISDPVRDDVPQAIQECMDAGIMVKIVTGDTPATATEIGRQIGLWLPGDTDANRITGTEFAELPDDRLLERIMDIKIISRARPMDKERLVRLLQQKGQVVAVTGDGTNDAPALNAAQVGLSMGDGTTVAKEASSITILDNSFSSITRAVMWGRSLYQNIQRFILFQLTINVVACMIILIGAFLGTESPLTITQMLWVNIIMDTFAALALASLPPNERVMKDKPRKPKDFIINRRMAAEIVSVGVLFVLLLFGLLQYFKYYDIDSLSEFRLGHYVSSFFLKGNVPDALSPYELTVFFTIFVLFQFWNLFNAKAFATANSAFTDISDSKVFWGVAAAVLLGQIFIVSFGGIMFNVEPLPFVDWIYIITGTSLVLWAGELLRLFRPGRVKIYHGRQDGSRGKN